MNKQQWTKAKRNTTLDDMDYRIIRLQARQKKYGLTPGEKRNLAFCYDWIETYFTFEGDND